MLILVPNKLLARLAALGCGSRMRIELDCAECAKNSFNLGQGTGDQTTAVTRYRSVVHAWK